VLLDGELEALCLKLQDYLCAANQSCSHLIVMSCLFPEDFNFDEYFENLSELNHVGFLRRVDQAKDQVAQLMKSREQNKG
jgi:hypothetical protein